MFIDFIVQYKNNSFYDFDLLAIFFVISSIIIYLYIKNIMNKHRYIKEILHLLEGKHLSSDEIFKKLKKTYPLLWIWTVYRNLSELIDDQKIIKTTWVLDTPIYELYKEPHGHIICKKARHVYDICIENLDFSKIDLPDNFEVEEINLSFTGTFVEQWTSCSASAKKFK